MIGNKSFQFILQHEAKMECCEFCLICVSVMTFEIKAIWVKADGTTDFSPFTTKFCSE